MKNEGKKFEEDFYNSVPDDVFKYRFKDGTAGFSGQKNENVRFQAQNIADYIMFDGRLFLLELKSHLGKSFPYTAVMGSYDKEKCKWSKEKQLNDLEKASHFKGIITGYVFNFRDLELTYFVPVRHVHYYFYHSERKSFPLLWVQEYGIPIDGYKKKVRYRYDIAKFLEVAK
jgi:penicillin-binding protein-related factor A (putative recombinase)